MVIQDQNVLDVKVITESECQSFPAGYDWDERIFDLHSQIDLLSSHADTLDYIVAAASGLLCGMLDVLWVGDFSLERGSKIASEDTDEYVKNVANNKWVKKIAKLCGYKGTDGDKDEEDLKSCVKFLENYFKIPSDGNTPDFGGGTQHHLRDFAHHASPIGFIFSLLTQFTEMSYGTDEAGIFTIVPVPEKSKVFIGESTSDKIFKGTIIWFLHIVSDMAGSSATVGEGGGTGVPGPLLSLAKSISSLPIFKNKDGKNSLSDFLTKLFEGTLFAKYDENGKVIKGTEIRFDRRGERGARLETYRQAIPVITNEFIVRTFYFLRRFAMELKEKRVESFSDIRKLDWDNIKPWGNPTITRMLTVATGVFTAIDVADAAASGTFFASINYVGIGRFMIALKGEAKYFLQRRDLTSIKKVYEEIRRNTFTQADNAMYQRIMQKFGLSVEQTELLYNLELFKAQNDLKISSFKKDLRNQWIDEWKDYMTKGFPIFVGDESAVLHWYTPEQLKEKISGNHPEKTWFRLMLLEAMLFEPYYTLGFEKDKNGKEIPSKKYSGLNGIFSARESDGDKFLEEFFTESYYKKGYIERLRKCHDEVWNELSGVSFAKKIPVLYMLWQGRIVLAPVLAFAMLGTPFAPLVPFAPLLPFSLGGPLLANLGLAYLGGGTITAGALGMLGGGFTIAGGGFMLGIGLNAGARVINEGMDAVSGIINVMTKKETVLQSAKLLVATREIFLNDENDFECATTIYEQYKKSISILEEQLRDLQSRLDEGIQDDKEKRELKMQIKNVQESLDIMQIALKSMKKFNIFFTTAAKLK